MITKFLKLYDIKDKLGQGTFGTVCRCVNKSTGQDFAVKIIKKDLPSNVFQDFLHEANICRKLQHTNIVRLLHSFDERDCLYLVFDLVIGGELMMDIPKHEFYSEAHASFCTQQILEGIHYCHKTNIVHRDLKPNNILLTSKGKDATIKIADFGLAIQVNGDEYNRYGDAGTTDYMSPEVLKLEAYGKPVDIWAIGVIVYVLLVGNLPFNGKTNNIVESQIKRGVFNYPTKNCISEAAKNIIEEMLTMDPNKRVTAHEALRDPWISQRDRVAPKIHLEETIGNLKLFNARRKFKAGILAAVAAKRFVKKSPTNVLEKRDILGNTGKDKTWKMQKDIFSNPNQTENPNPETEIIKLNEMLTNACVTGDSRTIAKLCDPNITTFDSYGSGLIQEGINFHNSFFENISYNSYNGSNTIILSPYVHFFGNETASIAYVRSTEYVGEDGRVNIEETEETRIWHKRDGQWKNVHFHSGVMFTNR